MAVRRVAKEDMTRIAKATGATMALTLSNMEGEETFEPTMLGYGEWCCFAHFIESDIWYGIQPNVFFFYISICIIFVYIVFLYYY